MDLQDLGSKYHLDTHKIEEFGKLGLLRDVEQKAGQWDFSEKDVHVILDMIHLNKLGVQGTKLVEFYKDEKNQLRILENTRQTVLKNLHEEQQKLDNIDYMIYERSKRH